MANDELLKIKKIYGEEMMHLCRDMFPTILEQEGVLIDILEKNIAPTHFLASDIKEKNLYEEFKEWIYSCIDVEEEALESVAKTPFELMDEAGYILYECKSEEDIQSFKKYYEPNEVLCTIHNRRRLERCHVFFAVKKNVEEIKRHNFKNPKRQDEYGISVISIQFSRGRINTLSIKNRYNHTVDNPDATFSNNLDNIIPGLTKSFEEYYGLNINQQAKKGNNFMTDELKYILANDGKYYRYNLELGAIYYCDNNIIVKDGEVILDYAQKKERYILMDYFILDLKEKRIYLYNDFHDGFIDSINDVGSVKNIDVIKNNENRIIHIHYENGCDVKIEINKYNEIIGYENNYITNINFGFLEYNIALEYIKIPNVQCIKSFFLMNNRSLRKLSLPNGIVIDDYFLYSNKVLSEIELSKVQTIGYSCLYHNEMLKEIYLPNIKTIYREFLHSNRELKEKVERMLYAKGKNR